MHFFQAVSLPVIIWLLRNRFLYQIHSYVTLLPSADMSASTTVDSRTRSDISVSDRHGAVTIIIIIQL